MERPPRAQSALQIRPSALQVRASRFMHKVSNFKTRLSGTKSGEKHHMNSPYTRSTDARMVKPYLSQPALAHDMPNSSYGPTIDGDDSSHSATPRSMSRGRSSHSSATEGPAQSAPSSALPVAAPTLAPAIDSLPDKSNIPLSLRPGRRLSVPVAPKSSSSSSGLSESPSRPTLTRSSARQSTEVSRSTDINTARINHNTEVSARTISPSISNTQQAVASNSFPFSTVPTDSFRSLAPSSAPSTPIPSSLHPTTITYNNSSYANQMASAATFPPATPSTPSTSRLPPRPSTTPHPNSGYSSHHLRFSPGIPYSARLSPTIITRHPMPPLNLPLLPPPKVEPVGQSEEERANLIRVRSQAKLKLMPALPRRGTGGPAPDENAEDGEGDEEEEDEEAALETADEVERPLSRASSRHSDTPSRSSSYHTDISDHDPVEPTPPISSDPPQITVSLLNDSHLSLSFLDHLPPLNGKGKSKDLTSEPGVPSATAKTWHSQTPDYFTQRPVDIGSVLKTPSVLPSTTPRPGDAFRTPRFVPKTPSEVPQHIPLPNSDVPGMYRLPSKSMINMQVLDKVVRVNGGQDVITEERRNGAMPPVKRGIENDIDSEWVELSDKDVEGMKPSRSTKPIPAPLYEDVSRQRRRSMPTFNPTSIPPPYPSFNPHPHSRPMDAGIFIAPRDDELEGRERLPQYSNDIYLKAIMPRKMEFTQPGVQARDRKWRRVMCELEGTVFRIYRCPASVAGVSAIGEWWESKVGVGDATAPPVVGSGRAAAIAVQKPTPERDAKFEGGTGQTDLRVPHPHAPTSSPGQQSQTPHQNRSRLNIAVNLLRPHSRSHSEVQNAAPRAASPRASLNLAVPSQGGSSSGSVGRSRSPSGTSILGPSSIRSPTIESNHSSGSNRRSSHTRLGSQTIMSGQECPDPDPANFIRAYTMQNAESGLGNDYLKRKNVIRVRLEGEQFLLQAKDVADVVDWIEGLHSATNIALDLDERVMPRGPLFPRRRRRRGTRRTEVTTVHLASNAATVPMPTQGPL